jgi:hypothetical protein
MERLIDGTQGDVRDSDSADCGDNSSAATGCGLGRSCAANAKVPRTAVERSALVAREITAALAGSDGSSVAVRGANGGAGLR